jgi:ribonuclease BN (tRNA processing enzyme)
MLLDCGTGAVHGLDRFDAAWREIDTVAISHYHSDHVGDLASLLAAFRFVKRIRPLTLVGPLGFADFMRGMDALFGGGIVDPAFSLEIVELEPRSSWSGASMGQLRCFPTPHTPESLAFRVDGAWGSLGYTGDTGPSRDVSEFLAGCSVVVSECARGDSSDGSAHLAPGDVAGLADIARPELLVLTHVYPPQTPEAAAAAVRERYTGPVVAAADGLTVVMRQGGVTIQSGRDRGSAVRDVDRTPRPL